MKCCFLSCLSLSSCFLLSSFQHTETVVANILEKLNGAVIESVRGPAVLPAPGVLASLVPDETGADVVHQGVVCDGCDRAIVGNRYKCG